MHAYQKISGDLKTDFFDSKKVVVLYGAEDFLVSAFAKKIKSRYIRGEGEALDFEEIDFADGLGGEIAGEDAILSKAAPLPMLSEKRVIIIIGLESQGSLTVKALAEKLPAHSIVIYAIKKPALKVGKASESVAVYDFARLDERTFGAFVVDRLAKFSGGKTQISNDALNAFMRKSDYFNKNSTLGLFEIENIIMQIAGYVSEGDVGEKDIDAFLSPSKEADVFELQKAILEKNSAKVPEIIIDYIKNDVPIFLVMSNIISEIESCLKYMTLNKEGERQDAMLSRLGIPKNLGFKLDIYARMSRKWSEPELTRLLYSFYEMEIALKSGLYNERTALLMFGKQG